MTSLGIFDRINNWIKNSVTLKLFFIGFLVLLLLIPSSLVKELILERSYTMEAAVNEVSSTWGGRQTISGPVLTVPYKHFWTDKDGKVFYNTLYAHFLPDDLSIDGSVSPEIRYRGIYEIVLYNTKTKVSGSFSSPDFADWNISNDLILWDDAFVSLGLGDLKGLQENITFHWNDSTGQFNPGVPTDQVVTSGVSTKVKLTESDTSYQFHFEINLNGSRSLSFLPLGEETNVRLASSWPNPSFYGNFLPDERNINNQGFDAKWKVLHLNRNYPQKWHNRRIDIAHSGFGVEFFQPVDVYQQTLRSIKYNTLFILLTFVAFFFVEILNKKRIHPIQYLLVGFGLTLFYSLLLSISEHLNFFVAYLVSSIAIIALITFYTNAVLKKLKLTILMGFLLITLYAFLYVLLQEQDYALLIGNAGLFIILALIMFITRKIDWYKINTDENEKVTTQFDDHD